MIRNYLKIAWRHLVRERLYSVINIIGLSVGAAVVLLIFLYVKEEWTFDRFHTKHDRIYRVWVKEHVPGNVFFNTVTPFILGPELAGGIPEVEQVVQYFTFSEKVEQGEFSDQERIHVISPSVFQVFDFPLLEGNPATALSGARQVVLTPAMAEKYFGKEPAVGRSVSIMLGGKPEAFTVSGIIAPAPANSSIQFDWLIPWENVRTLASEQGLTSWTNVTPETYVLLRQGVTPADIQDKVAALLDGKVADIYEPGEYQAGFQPLTDIHLDNDFPVGIVPVSDWRYPYILSVIGALIILLAGINFVTLAVGRSVNRAKEVGVRKVTGAARLQLMVQFWSEALLLAVIAVGLGVLLAEVSLPAFNQLADKQLAFHYRPAELTAIGGLALLLGLLAGIYPAFVLSGFSPIRALRGAFSATGVEKHVVLRWLVGFQFVLSIGLIICTLIMRQQLTFLQNKNLGYNKDQIIVLPYSAAAGPDKGLSEILEEGRQKAELLREALNGRPGFAGLSVATHTVGTPGWTQVGYTDPATEQFRKFRLLGVDYHFFDLMQIPMASGRAFSEKIGTDRTGGAIVNRAFARAYGLGNSVGQPLPKPFEAYTLIGITPDFNYASLHSAVEPLMMVLDPVAILRLCSDVNFNDLPTPKLAIKLSAGEVGSAVNLVRQTWSRVAPDQSFDPYFLEDTINRQYRAEQRLAQLLSIAMLLAIFIACLGLFGIATLSTARRTKEIGIRKVMGASVTDIVWLLNRSVTRLVLATTLLATPLAWYVMQRWLGDFAYRIHLHPLVFLAAGAGALAIAWLAVSYQSLRAARANPVESLRSE